MHGVKDSLLSAQDMPIQKRTHRKNYAETRQRIRWTKEMNLDIVHCFFKAITNSSTSYRRSMHRYWKQLYPDTTFSEQRIADQKKQIFSRANNTNPLGNRGHWLTNLEIEAVKCECYNLFDGAVKVGKGSSNVNSCNDDSIIITIIVLMSLMNLRNSNIKDVDVLQCHVFSVETKLQVNNRYISNSEKLALNKVSWNVNPHLF